MGASGMGMVACWWVAMLMQGGIFFTLEKKDCLFAIVIFLFICFRHRLYFCPQATWSLTEANRSLWTNNIQQLALSIGCISRLFYWYKLFSAITCAVLSMMRLISQDFGQTKSTDMPTRNFAINVFYVLALIETMLLLLALILRMLFERAKEEKEGAKEENNRQKEGAEEENNEHKEGAEEENNEHKEGAEEENNEHKEGAEEENNEHKEGAKEENIEHKEEKDDENEAEHEIIEMAEQTTTAIQQQDSSNPMLNNNGEGTSHTLTGKEAPEKFFSKENTRGRRTIYVASNSEKWSLEIWKLRVLMARLLLQFLKYLYPEDWKMMFFEDRSLETLMLPEWVAISLGWIVSLWAATMIFSTLETRDCMFATVIFLLVCIRLFNSCLHVARYVSGNNNIQHISGIFYWFHLVVSALICVVLSMMGLVSQYYGQTEVTNMVSKHVLSFYCLTLAEALLSLSQIRYTRIMTMLQTFIDAMPGRQRIKELRKASEHPAAFIPEREKCKIIEKKTK